MVHQPTDSHHSTADRARRTVTTLIETNALQLSHATTRDDNDKDNKIQV